MKPFWPFSRKSGKPQGPPAKKLSTAGTEAAARALAQLSARSQAEAAKPVPKPVEAARPRPVSPQAGKKALLSVLVRVAVPGEKVAETLRKPGYRQKFLQNLRLAGLKNPERVLSKLEKALQKNSLSEIIAGLERAE